jgi:hypothetical protein
MQRLSPALTEVNTVVLKDFIEQTLEDFRGRVHRALRGLTPEELAWSPDTEANSIGFIVWHVARVEDRWLHRFAQDGVELWVADGWHERFGLPEGDTGLGYDARQIAFFPNLSSEDLLQYLDDVRARTIEYVGGLGPEDFDVAPGRTPFPERPSTVRYFEGCTIGRMFRQLIGELNQHLGQVAYLRGLQRGLDR